MAINVETYELTLNAKSALAEYLALPDRNEIIARLQLVNSAADAVQQIRDASTEAWCIRATLAKSWAQDVLWEVDRLLVKQIGKLHPTEKKGTPSVRACFAAMYPKGIIEHVYAHSREIWLGELRDAKKRAAKSRSNEAQKVAGTQSTQRRERRLMVKCAEEFIRWADKEGEGIIPDNVPRFPKVEGMAVKRTHELLRTLIAARNAPSIRNDLLETLQRCGFPHATQEAVDECMTIRKTSTRMK